MVEFFKAFIIILLSFIVFILYKVLLKKTVFGFSLSRPNYFGFFFFSELFIFLIPGVILLNIFPIGDFYAIYKAKQESIFWISLLVLFTFIALIFNMYVFSRLYKNTLNIDLKNGIELNVNEKSRIVKFSFFIIFICTILMLAIVATTDANHAIINSISKNISISISRSINRNVGFANLLNYMFIFISPLLGILAGSNAFDKSFIKRLLVFLFSLFFASYMGSKSPIINTILAFVFSYLAFHNIRFSFKLIRFLIILLIIIPILLYQIVLLQYPNYNFEKIVSYFINRVFIAQISGVYEQFNLFLYNWRYFWHSIPIVSSFVEHPVFQKDLMMVSEGRTDPSTIGIKNTLFIAEAYSYGGWLLVLLSPFIYVLNLSIVYAWFYKFFDLAIRKKTYTKVLVALFIFNIFRVSGGFSEILFFKLPIFITFLFLPFVIGFNIINRLRFK